MDIYEDKQGSEITLTIEGRLDAITSARLEKAFERIRGEQGIKKLTLNLGKVVYISSAGLRVIIVMMKYLNSIGAALAVNGISPAVKDVLSTSGLIKLFVRDEKYLIIQNERTLKSITLTLAGDFDDAGISELQAMLDQAVRDGASEIVLQLRKPLDAEKSFLELLEKWQEVYNLHNPSVELLYVRAE
jgi:anti-sigma B factor antagonist